MTFRPPVAMRHVAGPLAGRAAGRPPSAGQARRLKDRPGWLCAGPILTLLVAAGCSGARVDTAPVVQVGSKQFTEGVILGELARLLIEDAGVPAAHDRGRELGSTRVLWDALVAGEIDVYADYTGTISQEILRGTSLEDLPEVLAEHGLRMSEPLGFNNTYAIGMPEALAERLGIRTISDLRAHRELVFRFSSEFMDRADGWPGLRAAYGLPQTDVAGIEHDLAYAALASGSVAATDVYSTDAKIGTLGLRVLDDDRGYFPRYDAVYLYRAELQRRAPEAVAALRRLEGTISEGEMVAMNAAVEVERRSETAVAAEFLAAELSLDAETHEPTLAARLWQHSLEHLYLVTISLSAAILLAVPLGIAAAKQPTVGQAILAVTGVIQTVPAIALLVFMIPLLGLGAAPAIAALFLYSLLPIVRNTYAGLHEIPGPLHESARALGLPAWARLWRIELPLASRAILAGIKTSAVINVGTAALGGFIGAGGYGQLIFRGIRQTNTALILEGAVPAALLAIAVQGLFELAERRFVPKGLRLKGSH